MVGLKNKLKQLNSQKSEISKIRRKGENEYKKVKSAFLENTPHL